MITNVEISRLLPHPENCNRMDAETLKKLRRHIERTGRYEPIVVRPHPTEKEMYQIINGHHRVQVLKTLERQRVKCVVWDVDDDQARLYLATLNRLSGEDVPERRALLVSNLIDGFGIEELAQLLPEGPDQLRELERLVHADLEELPPAISDEDHSPGLVILEFFLDRHHAQEVNLALDLIAHRHGDVHRKSDALVRLASDYIERDGSSPTGSSRVKGEA